MKLVLVIGLLSTSLFSEMYRYGETIIDHNSRSTLDGAMFLEVPKMNKKIKSMYKREQGKKFPEQVEVMMPRKQMMQGSDVPMDMMMYRDNSSGYYYSSQRRNCLKQETKGYNHFGTMN